MLNQAGVPVYTNEHLASVTMSGQTITQITMDDGTIYRREGVHRHDLRRRPDGDGRRDLHRRTGRNRRNYGESFAGAETPGDSYNYDPVRGGRQSPPAACCPWCRPSTAGTVGQGDNKVQTYNFRLCLTQIATNLIPITAPANYSETQYELVRRYIAARVANERLGPSQRA